MKRTAWYIVILERLNHETCGYDSIQVGSYLTQNEARLTVNQLVKSGIDRADLSIITR